jgi:hypothetical protein
VEQLTRFINESSTLPLCNQISNLILEGRYQEVVDFRIDYSWSFTVDDFIASRQVQALLIKQDFLDLGIDLEAVAFGKFIDSERMCSETNVRLDLNQPSPGVASVLHYAMRKIDKILGDVPTLSDLHFSFGPGATTSTSSITASPRAKMSDQLECSMNLFPSVRKFLSEFPLLCEAHSDDYCIDSSDDEFDTIHYQLPVTIAPGKLSFVPKDCTKYRSIVVEPSLNGLGQKGIGSYMKEKLKCAGIDLKDQSRNQSLARKGSIDGTLATIDLSMASDCISSGLVWSLLPFEWASLLDTFRSSEVTYKPMGARKDQEITVQLEKFSSMGNAYTFELESLLFYSLAFATCQYLGVDTCNLSVYGDDIIIASEAYDLLKDVLEYCGFLLNEKKSFATGPFRESCGADYYKGIDIRPYYLKTGISGRVLFNMHNFFFRQGDIKIAREIESMIPEPLRIYGPDGYGDGHLIGEWHPRSSRRLKRFGYDGGFFDTYVANPRSIHGIRKGDYVYPSYSIYMPPDEDYEFQNLIPDPVSPTDSMYTVRGTRGYSKVSIYTLSRCIFNRASLKNR